MTVELLLLRKHADFGGFRRFSGNSSPVRSAEPEIAVAAAVFPLAGEQKDDHLHSDSVLYSQFAGAAGGTYHKVIVNQEIFRSIIIVG
jgi:hypothetical protein